MHGLYSQYFSPSRYIWAGPVLYGLMFIGLLIVFRDLGGYAKERAALQEATDLIKKVEKKTANRLVKDALASDWETNQRFYYSAKSRARLTLGLTVVVCLIGFGCLLLAVFLFYGGQLKEGAISTVANAMSLYAAKVFITMWRNAANDQKAYHISLLSQQRIAQAFLAVELLPKAERPDAIRSLIRANYKGHK